MMKVSDTIGFLQDIKRRHDEARLFVQVVYRRKKTMSEKLKPCPFCGGNAELESSYADYVGSGLHKIVCKVCGCQTNYEHPMQKAIDVWNRRAEK